MVSHMADDFWGVLMEIFPNYMYGPRTSIFSRKFCRYFVISDGATRLASSLKEDITAGVTVSVGRSVATTDAFPMAALTQIDVAARQTLLPAFCRANWKIKQRLKSFCGALEFLASVNRSQVINGQKKKTCYGERTPFRGILFRATRANVFDD
uniref:Uncharacterized protein n=1 Tax=Romanomermis culicivorax TaxID=13658 RepID=A0A915L9D4_ROMCU